MDKKILVAYASKYGATAEIAEKIGTILRQSGYPVDVVAVKNVSDLNSYRAVVLGSAMYMGFWRKEAAQFLKSNEQALAERPVWLFSSGPSGEGDPVKLLNGRRLAPAEQQIADRIRPHNIAVFHGNLDAKKINFFEKWVIQRVKAQTGDFRDWAMIDSWAASIGEALK